MQPLALLACITFYRKYLAHAVEVLQHSFLNFTTR